MLRNMRPDMTSQQQQLQMMRMQQNGGMNMAMKQPSSIAQRAMANNQNKYVTMTWRHCILIAALT